MNKLLKGIGLYLLIALVAVSIVSTFYQPGEKREDMKYSTFMQNIKNDEVIDVKVVGAHDVYGQLKDGTKFHTYVLNARAIADRLQAKGVEVELKAAPKPSFWAALMPQLLTTLIFVGVLMFILQQMQGGGNRAMSFGKSRARLHSEEKGKVTFDDVAGEDEAKEELVEIVEFLKHPKKFIELGAKIPKGVLLVGPPGTGKTLLGKAVAGEAGVPFFSISGSDFVEMFVGVGASRVRDLFEQAKKNAPCIVFIDEIDAVGRQRGAGLGGGHDEREQTLNQLLVEMDGFESNAGVIILAATNRPDVLDPALLRPGRFDRQVVVDVPDLNGREAILGVHSKNKPLQEDISLKVLARRTPGFTGADLENLMNEAALLAARRGRKRISMDECEEAIERVIAGPEKRSKLISDKEKDIVAYHEGGHALTGLLLANSDPVHKVSIIPRGSAGGYTLMLPTEDKNYHTRSELLDRVVGLLGGRAAEEIALKEISTGAQNDLERATKLVRRMITEFGMSETLGHMTFGKGHEDQVFLGRDISRDRNYSEEVAAAIDREARKLMEDSYDRAVSLLTENRSKLDAIAQALKERETLDADELRALAGIDGGDN